MKVRVIFDGKVFGVIKAHWSASRTLKESELVAAQWLQSWLDGMPVKVGSVLRGNIAVVIEQV